MDNRLDRKLFLGSLGLAVCLVGAQVTSWAGDVWHNAQQARAGIAETRRALAPAEAPSPVVDGPSTGKPVQSLDVLRMAQACDAAGKTSGALTQLNGQVSVLKPLLGALDAVPTLGRQARTQATALEAGAQVSAAAAALCQQVQPIAGLLQSGEAGKADEPIGTALRALVQARPSLMKAADSLDGAGKELAAIPAEDLNSSGAQAAAALRERTPQLARSLRDAAGVLAVLDRAGPHRFLLVSQNPDEIRATGGFIGSAGVLEVEDGQIRLVEYGSSRAYDTPSSFRAAPPAELQRYLGSTYWHLAGANWTPSFPDAAQQIAYFYALSHPGAQLDGVIALDQFGLARLLEATGPVEVPDYGQTVSAENVAAELDKHIHVDNVAEARRKQFAASVSAAVFKQLTTAPASALPKVAQALRTAVDEQHLLAWVREPEAARVLAQKRWNGGLLKADADYLMVVDSEVSFSKQSQEVGRDAEYQVEVPDTGSPTARLTLTYVNRSVKRSDWYRPVYRSWVRAYAPAGAELASSSGFNGPVTTYQECGRTVFAGEVSVATGATQRATFVYRLPARVVATSGYDLVLQQQPGVPPGRTVGTVRWQGSDRSVDAPYAGTRQAPAHWHLTSAIGQMESVPLPEAEVAPCSSEPVRAQPLAAPTAVTIPSIGVAAGIAPLAVGKDGVMEAPDGPDLVGWYRTSARPGQPGNLVLSGHLDWRDRLAVFARLKEVKVGDRIVVKGEDGVERTYAVEWNRSFPRDRAPLEEIVAGSDDPLLTIITCDGVFDQATKDYSNRRAVRARLVA